MNFSLQYMQIAMGSHSLLHGLLWNDAQTQTLIDCVANLP